MAWFFSLSLLAMSVFGSELSNLTFFLLFKATHPGNLEAAKHHFLPSWLTVKRR